jgi:hypothetical protein
MGIFREEAIARMNGIDVGYFRGADDSIDSEVAFVRGGFSDANGFISELDVHGIGIRLGIDGNRSDVELFASPNDPDGNFSAISYKNFFEHLDLGPTYGRTPVKPDDAKA